MKTLILGGARSGKSQRGLALAEAASPHRLFIATAEAFDSELQTRIHSHQHQRGTGWSTQEVPLDLVGALTQLTATHQGICLVDCLTLWLGNLMHYGWDIAQETQRLCNATDQAQIPIIFISNEVGMGLVPETKIGRDFRDHQGRLNQQLATVCDVVECVIAGLPWRLKGGPHST